MKRCKPIIRLNFLFQWRKTLVPKKRKKKEASTLSKIAAFMGPFYFWWYALCIYSAALKWFRERKRVNGRTSSQHNAGNIPNWKGFSSRARRHKSASARITKKYVLSFFKNVDTCWRVARVFLQHLPFILSVAKTTLRGGVGQAQVRRDFTAPRRGVNR